MNSLQLAPYNESMQLGQGYNSFLQLPCVYDAIEVKGSVVKKAVGRNGVPQVVSYSSRIVTKVSELTRSMNISAGASVKSGSITVSGNQSAIDETKLATSDLNVVISVKVINQTTGLDNTTSFKPIIGVNKDNFHDVYGDSYISGFIDGGELHCIVSIRVLDSTRKEKIVTSLKQRLNGVDPKAFALRSSEQSSTFAPELKETETSIFVNWCGGGQIKKAEEQWTIYSVFRAAAAFPNKVDIYPQRCWAILTRYTNNSAFLSSTPKFSIRDYSNAQQYAADLLDDFMEYKSNLRIIEQVFDEPMDYVLGPGGKPVDVRAEALVQARKKIKSEMAKIVSEINALNQDPTEKMKDKNLDIKSPEVWATRLPILRAVGQVNKNQLAAPSDSVIDVLSKFNYVDENARTQMEALILKVKSGPTAIKAPESTVPNLASGDALNAMNPKEKEFVQSLENRRRFAPSLQFDKPVGKSKQQSMSFNDAEQIPASAPAAWPTSFEIRIVTVGEKKVLGSCKLVYPGIKLEHGTAPTPTEKISIQLEATDRITSITLGSTDEAGVNFVEVHVNSEVHRAAGDSSSPEKRVKCVPPPGFSGLKGFYGHEEQGTFQRIGVIWGK